MSDGVVSKHMDLSCFKYDGSTVPREIYSFFDADSMKNGDRIDLVLYYNGNNYSAYLKRESNPKLGRIRIFWNAQLAQAINDNYDYRELEKTHNYPYMIFIKISSTEYDLHFSIVPEMRQIIQDASDLDMIYEGELVFEQRMEGLKKEVFSVYYERDVKNRENAIKIHGLKCMVCGFDFQKTYGERGKDYIEVHHNKPLHSFKESMLVDPYHDLDCVCSNCHRMIHRFKNDILSVEELRNIVVSNSKINNDKRTDK